MYVSTYICNIVHVGKLLFDFLIDCMFFMLYKFFIFGELYCFNIISIKLCIILDCLTKNKCSDELGSVTSCPALLGSYARQHTTKQTDRSTNRWGLTEEL